MAQMTCEEMVELLALLDKFVDNFVYTTDQTYDLIKMVDHKINAQLHTELSLEHEGKTKAHVELLQEKLEKFYG